MEVRGINSETVADEDGFDLFVEKPNARRSRHVASEANSRSYQDSGYVTKYVINFSMFVVISFETCR